MKIALFVDNRGIGDIDFSHLDKTNPGVGGTEYMFFLLAWLLSVRDNDISVTLYLTEDCNLSPDIFKEIVGDVHDAYARAQINGFDYFILRNKTDLLFKIRQAVPLASLPLIVWCHNFSWKKDLDIWSTERLVKRLVCVGKEQMNLYINHRAFLKSDYIYNAININELTRIRHEKALPFSSREHIVTYMGSLVPWKGFHILARNWHSIVDKVPDVQLYVIGSGALYSRKAELGEAGLASQKYEDEFLPYLTSQGSLLQNVHFMGVLGDEKYDLLGKTKVGIPNPSGISETFGITAVEMQALGAHVVAKKCPGFIDTVRMGCLFDKESDFVDFIVAELLREEDDVESFEDLTVFSQIRFAKEWEVLLKSKMRMGKFLHPVSFTKNQHEQHKYTYRFYQLASIFPFLYTVSDFFSRRKATKRI